MTQETIESMLTRIALEFDRQYFNGIGLVVGVKFARFYWDWRQLRSGTGMIGVTFGLYDGETRVIYINAYFHKLLRYGLMLREVKSIIFHELCHGVLMNSLQPIRLGLYHHDHATGGHGADFQALEHKYADRVTNEEMNNHIPSIVEWMRVNVPKKIREE